MRSDSDGRRLGKRYKRGLDVELHTKAGGSLVRAVDVSRHGLFLAMPNPPPANHVVLLTVHLPDAPFETMALVARRTHKGAVAGVEEGAGVKLYCLASDAKARWDHFIAGLSGREVSLTPRATIPSSSASFLVQLETTAEIEEFFNRHVRQGHIVHVTPALKQLGAEVLLVLVHPDTKKEFVLRAAVAELYPDRPLRMGIRFVDVDMPKRMEFRRFLGITRDESEPAPQSELVSHPRNRFTEYAFYSPKLPGRAPISDDETPSAVAAADEASEELATIEGDLLELEELDDIAKGALFDFNWRNDE